MCASETESVCVCGGGVGLERERVYGYVCESLKEHT